MLDTKNVFVRQADAKLQGIVQILSQFQSASIEGVKQCVCLGGGGDSGKM